MIVVSIVSLSTKGLDQGIDFVGGRTYQVRFDKELSTETVTKDLTGILGSAEVKTIGSANQLKISTKYLVEENSAEADSTVQAKLYEGLVPYLPQGVTYEDFSREKMTQE